MAAVSCICTGPRSEGLRYASGSAWFWLGTDRAKHALPTRRARCSGLSARRPVQRHHRAFDRKRGHLGERRSAFDASGRTLRIGTCRKSRSPSPAPTRLRIACCGDVVRRPPDPAVRSLDDSSGTTSGTTTPASETAFAIVFLLVPEQQDQDDDRDWHSQKPEQDSAAHETLLSPDVP
jgi:hypothetical protein